MVFQAEPEFADSDRNEAMDLSLTRGPIVSNESILIVEDDAVVIKILESQFRTAGYKVVAAKTTAEAIRSTVTQQPDLMILDLTLIDGTSVNGLIDGLSLLEWLRRMLPEGRFPVIIHTCDNSPDLEERTRSYGVKGVFRKGKPVKELLEAVRAALNEHPTGSEEARDK